VVKNKNIFKGFKNIFIKNVVGQTTFFLPLKQETPLPLTFPLNDDCRS
jgi:hypothetical protein